MTDTILIVDDEPDLCGLVDFHLREAGFATEVVQRGLAALPAAARVQPAVVVLDLMLPDFPGTEICRRIRAEPGAYGDPAVLMLTARADEADRVLGFEVGADDYVVKPFSVKELVMRVRALARRATERRAALTARDEGRRRGPLARAPPRGRLGRRERRRAEQAHRRHPRPPPPPGPRPRRRGHRDRPRLRLPPQRDVGVRPACHRRASTLGAASEQVRKLGLTPSACGASRVFARGSAW